jgi:hypothetical protein
VGGWVFGKKVSLRTTSQLHWDVVKNYKLLEGGRVENCHSNA